MGAYFLGVIDVKKNRAKMSKFSNTNSRINCLIVIIRDTSKQESPKLAHLTRCKFLLIDSIKREPIRKTKSPL